MRVQASAQSRAYDVLPTLRAVSLPLLDGVRSPPATFFIREAEAAQQMANGGMLNMQPGRIDQCVAHLKEGNVGILRDEFPKNASCGAGLPLPVGRPCGAG